MTSKSWARDLVTALIGLWIVTGIYIDGWAHVHLLDLIDTFFTPWHASFYSGVAAMAGWLGIILLRTRQPGEQAMQTIKRLPPGYRGGLLGVVIFAIGGACDMLWHTLLGFEASIDALLSPPHLVLLTGVLLMGTTAWRSQRALTPTTTLPELISLVSVVAICAFFLNFLSPFYWAAPALRYAENRNENLVIMWTGGLLVTTILLLVPVLWQVRDGRHRIGVLTAFTAFSGTGVAVAMSRDWGLGTLLTGVAFATLGALISDVLIARAQWRQHRYGLPAVFAASALIIWSLQLLAYEITVGIRWPATLWGGTLLFAAGAAAALASVAWRPTSTPS